MKKEMMDCERCEKEIEKKAYNQRYCTPCNGEKNRENGRARSLKNKKELENRAIWNY